MDIQVVSPEMWYRFFWLGLWIATGPLLYAIIVAAIVRGHRRIRDEREAQRQRQREA